MKVLLPLLVLALASLVYAQIVTHPVYRVTVYGTVESARWVVSTTAFVPVARFTTNGKDAYNRAMVFVKSNPNIQHVQAN